MNRWSILRSLRAQLVISHLFLVLIMTFVMGAAVWQFWRISHSVEQILQENFTTVLAAQDMDSALAREETAFVTLSTGDTYRARDMHHDAQDAFTVALSTAAGSTSDEEEDIALAEISADASQLRSLATDLFNPNRLTLQPGTPRVINRVVLPLASRLRTKIRSLRAKNEEAVLADYRGAQSRAQRAAGRSILTSVVALILAVLLGLRLVQQALNPLANLARRAERIASGVFQPGEETTRMDEVGALAQSFESMEVKLAEMRATEARRLLRAEQMSDAALESLYDPVVVTDSKRRIVHLNRAAEGLFGEIPVGERRPAEEHIPDRRVLRAIDGALAQKVAPSEDEAAIASIKVGEADRTYRLRATPMTDEGGHLLGSVTVLEDITHLRVVDRIKTEFIGVASHELRTPVTSLILANQLLLEGAVGELNEAQREVVDAQQQDLNRLEKLMRDLLDVTRLEAGSAPPRFEILGPYDIAHGPVATLKPQAARKGLTLIFDVPKTLPRVRADRLQIGRAITNLLANAIRHTNAGGSVALRATVAGNDVCFRVEDTGEGIPRDYLERIFERFVQVPGATQGGAGLGLAITQNIVRAHGGQMSVESVVGEGSVFGFTLPIDPASVEGNTA